MLFNPNNVSTMKLSVVGMEHFDV